MIHSRYGCYKCGPACKLAYHLCYEENYKSKARDDHQRIALVSRLEVAHHCHSARSSGHYRQLISKHTEHQKCDRDLNSDYPRLCISICKTRAPGPDINELAEVYVAMIVMARTIPFMFLPPMKYFFSDVVCRLFSALLL